MKWLLTSSRKRIVAMVVLLAFCGSISNPARGQSALDLKNWSGIIDYSADGPSPFALKGTASHIGNFEAVGEVEFVPG